jgi:NADH-quinone oxidoreductase subunit M
VNPHLLSVLIGLPLLAALVVLCAPKKAIQALPALTVLAALVELLISFVLLSGDYSTARYQFVERALLVEKLGIHYALGVDGISLWLVLLTTALTPIALFASWRSITARIKEYAFSFLLLEAGMLGALVALDLVLFYLFCELMLIPMALIIGVWGGERRVYAATKYVLFSLVGSLLMLVAIVYLGVQYQQQTNAYSFEIGPLTEITLPLHAQLWLFAAFAVAFAVKVPMFPLHTWLPDLHAEAPTGGSFILAAVLTKLGCYGFLRFAMPLFPLACHVLAPTLVALAIVGITYGAYCAWVQKDVKRLLAYSSVSHLGFVMLGVFGLTIQGVSGAILQMVNHGISTGALFLLVGVVYERRHTSQLSDFGGLAKVMPNYAAVFMVVALSSMGLPGTNGFIGEFLILAGTFLSESLGPLGPVYCMLAATGVILAAIYILHLVLKILFGPVSENNRHLPDLDHREMIVLGPLILLVFWIGIFPSAFLKPMEPSVKAFTHDYLTKVEAGNKSPDRCETLNVRIDARGVRR